ncbi:pregnancy-specific beta-1-glycoprotein 11-like isoform X2 [Oryzias latipes]
MTSVIGLLLMLITVTDGVVTHCDGRQNGTQCYGALGGTVSLQLMDDFSGIYRYQLKAKNVKVLSGRNNTPPVIIMKDRSSFIPSNGTFWIHNLSRNDSGEYKLQTFDSNGKQTENRTLQLLVQAPVSSVSLVSECLSQGEMKESCSSEGGDSPQYKWTLNGKSLTEAELLSGNKQTNIITLKQHVSGRLVCSSWNHVSSASKEINITNCAPVSSVSLVSECLSQGAMKVSCSSEGGDSPQYRWTLNGKSLTEAELLSGNKQTNIITLKQHVSGRLVCSSWNHVSSASKEINITNCGFIYINCTFNGTKISKWVFQENNTLCVEPTTETQSIMVHTYPSMLRCSLTFLFSVVSFVGIGVYFKWKKIKYEKAEQFAARNRTKFSEDFYENEQTL